MGVRNLGDWSALELEKDPIYTDLERIEKAGKRYHNISVTINDAITKLGKIVDVGSDSLAGQYVESLKSEATSIRDNLTKAKTRYDDVAREIAKYQPKLESALGETALALVDAKAAEAARGRADTMADPQPAEDGTIPPEERGKSDLKKRAIDGAAEDLEKAKKKLNAAMDALNVAGRSFGDAVNSKQYGDGLSDSGWDKFLDFLENIGSTILSVLGALAAIALILVPGVNVVLLAAAAIATLTLVVDITLYANGRGSLADVILSAIGLALLGGTAIASMLAKSKAALASVEALREQERARRIGLELGEFAPSFPVDVPPDNAATLWRNLSDWFNNPFTNWFIDKLWPTLVPEIGFLASTKLQWNAVIEMWRTMTSGNFLSNVKGLVAVIGGLNGIRDLAAVMAAVGRSISGWWYVWGLANSAYTILHGILYTLLRIRDVVIPAVRPGTS